MHWNEYFGTSTIDQKEILNAYNLIPELLIKILAKPCPAFPDKRIIESHIIVWIPESINGKEFTVRNFGELIKQKMEFSKNPTGYRRNWSSIMQQECDKPIEHGFVLMTTDIIPDSQDVNYTVRESMVKRLYKTYYTVPKIGEAIVCIAANYFKNKKRLFSEQPLTYTHCQEYVNEKYVTIGNFQESGFLVGRLTLVNNDSIPSHTGVAALRRFKSNLSL